MFQVLPVTMIGEIMRVIWSGNNGKLQIKDSGHVKVNSGSTVMNIDLDEGKITMKRVPESLPAEADVESNTDMTDEHWQAMRKVVAKGDDGEAVQMPGNWSAEDVMECMTNDLGMPFHKVMLLIRQKDLMLEILEEFHQNLAAHGWSQDMEDAITHVLEEHEAEQVAGMKGQSDGCNTES